MGLMKGRQGEAWGWRGRAGAWRAEPSSPERADQTTRRSVALVRRTEVQGRGARLGRAVWPEGRELKLYTASERIVPFLRSFPFPLLPLLLIPWTETPREEWARGGGGRAC